MQLSDGHTLVRLDPHWFGENDEIVVEGTPFMVFAVDVGTPGHFLYSIGSKEGKTIQMNWQPAPAMMCLVLQRTFGSVEVWTIGSTKPAVLHRVTDSEFADFSKDLQRDVRSLGFQTLEERMPVPSPRAVVPLDKGVLAGNND